MEDNKILIIDDDAYIIRVLSHILEREGYDVYSAMNGEEGIEKAKDVQPDIIFLDIILPGKDGYAVCKEIRSTPDLKKKYVIMLSSVEQQQEIEEKEKSGANEYMTKPFSPKDVIDKVKVIFGARA